MRLIRSEACIAEGTAWLVKTEPRFARVTGPVELRLREDGFAAVIEAIVGQQVSTAAAAAILGRLHVAGIETEAQVLAAGEIGLAACGMSRPKIRYALALADAGMDFAALRLLPDDDVIAQLTAHKGIGRWTAEIYAIFALGRADVMPAGDLALQVAAQHLFDLPQRPTEQELRVMARSWSPWRAVAARMLFAYYRQVTSRKGIT